ncbi:uncharacterized protein LOC143375264 [Andrena cerasifolii]|uniref:uncharacterized protein LOC143375264 n=1 Tax=Andrena cerasifolii TaxID=2819439 RepID=UPI004037AFC2
MKLTKLIACLSQIRSGNALLTRNAISQARSRGYSTDSAKKVIGDEFDVPIKYSTSRAAKAPAVHTIGRYSNYPAHQTIVISMSLTVFLLYFCVFREENDIDQQMMAGLTPEVQQNLYGIKAPDYKQRHSSKPM